MIENVMKEKGIHVITGKTVKKIQGKTQDEDEVHRVILDNDEELNCDYVVFATGVVPRTELVIGTRVNVKDGIIVDNSMRTTQPDVYACGDVTESYDYVLDKHHLMPLWPIAYMGGRVAGHNMAGKKSVYRGGTAMNSLNYFGIPIMSSGIIPPKEGSFEFLTHMSQEKNAYRKIVLKENVVVGMLLVNKIKGAGIINYLMRNRVNVKAFKIHLATESFGLANLPTWLREKMFWGEGL
jgi:NAD(P)H-nitrite reductase large subunit